MMKNEYNKNFVEIKELFRWKYHRLFEKDARSVRLSNANAFYMLFVKTRNINKDRD